MPRHDYDSPWKEMLSEYFEQFITFFFPDVSRDIDWTRKYELLDKELRQITREAEIGVRLADHLVKVWKKSGEETWVLVHIEVQAQEKTDFPHRLYVYNYRIHDRYHRPVASFAVLADDNPKWRPTRYTQKLWGCRTEFYFPVVKLLMYRDHQETLKASDNPFAIVVLAHLKTLETQKDDQSRMRWKVSLTKELYRRGFSRSDILKLYHFIDWLMVLPEDLEQACYRDIEQFEEEHKMPYITTAERIGRTKGLAEGLEKGKKEGLEKGKKEGLEKGTLIGEILLAQRILRLTIYSKEELEGKSLEELKDFFAKFEAKLKLPESQSQEKKEKPQDEKSLVKSELK